MRSKTSSMSGASAARNRAKSTGSLPSSFARDASTLPMIPALRKVRRSFGVSMMASATRPGKPMSFAPTARNPLPTPETVVRWPVDEPSTELPPQRWTNGNGHGHANGSASANGNGNGTGNGTGHARHTSGARVPARRTVTAPLSRHVK